MKKLLTLMGLLVFSCALPENNLKHSKINPQVIAYYAGDEKSIDEFNLTGVDQLINS